MIREYLRIFLILLWNTFVNFIHKTINLLYNTYTLNIGSSESMKKILIISSFLLIIIAISTIGYSIVSANVYIDETEDIITYQENKENYITPYGYTLDNPNIILDPYGISPLTALILFETEKSQPVTITVQGKDKESTYTNTFESTTRHYIPVYGLYANYINHITLKCGNKTKEITIETKPLPIELLSSEENNSTNLTFITTDNYPYAIDNNNDIRWYLTKKYYGEITFLENNHFLLGDAPLIPNTNSNTLLELDLLGKVYKQYLLDTPYLGYYKETNNTLIINNEIEIDKQTGNIINNKEKSLEVFSNTNSIMSFYKTNSNHKLLEGVKYNLTKETEKSKKNIFLIGYKEPDKTYQDYNIKIQKNNEFLQIIGEFTKDDEVYLILDKFLDKRIYDIKNNHTIINKQGLSGMYSIYISINNTIYNTNNYIQF